MSKETVQNKNSTTTIPNKLNEDGGWTTVVYPKRKPPTYQKHTYEKHSKNPIQSTFNTHSKAFQANKPSELVGPQMQNTQKEKDLLEA